MAGVRGWIVTVAGAALMACSAALVLEARADPGPGYHSPFNGDMASDSAEAASFARLVDLYVNWRRLEQEVHNGCDHEDRIDKIERAEAARKRFETALDDFVKNSGTAVLPANPKESDKPEIDRLMRRDRAKVLDLVAQKAVVPPPRPCESEGEPLTDHRLPPCDDPEAINKAINGTLAKIGAIDSKLERDERVLKADVTRLGELKSSNAPEEQIRSAQAVVDADNKTVNAQVAQRMDLLNWLVDLRSIKLCPRTPAAPLPKPTPGEGPLPPCNDPKAIEADIDGTKGALRKAQEALERIRRVKDGDIKAANSAKAINGVDSAKYKAADAVVKADENLEKKQKAETERLEKRLADLDKISKSCPPETGAPVEPKPEPTPVPKSDKHAGIPPCDDGSDQLANRIAADEDALAALRRDNAGAASDREASLQDELTALNALKACPAEYRAPKEDEDDGGILGHVTIGVGVGTGGGHRDDRGHGDKPVPRTHCDLAPVRRFT